ncbi:MAG: flagellar basal body L-ring protein FlgH [Planctomycetota bacterium]|nr:flagellar basal body L-ring protein FlgH [Planctomycetota bacterium]
MTIFVRLFTAILCVSVSLALVSAARAQSSSLYVDPVVAPEPPPAPTAPNAPPNYLSPSLSKASLISPKIPEPRKFGLQDLVTIVIRESTEDSSSSKLNTSKENNIDGTVSDFPNLRLMKQFVGLVSGTALTDDPKVGVKFKNEFKGSGDQSRKDSITSRITARIIDIKPNGTLVLEARSHIRKETESTEVVLTGTARKEDIATDNTLLSTQLYDLHLSKQVSGEVAGAAKKGVFSKILSGIFNF